jgi:hypothetical protein
LLLSSFDFALVDIPCIVPGIGSILFCFPLTYTLDLFPAALHVHNCTKAHLDFDPQLLSIIVYVSIISLFTIETIQLKSVKVLKSWKISSEKFSRYQGLNLGLQLPTIMSLMHILLNSIDADMKSEIGSSRRGLRPYPLKFHVKEAGAGAKLIQHGPLVVAYHHRHPILTIPVAKIKAHATAPGTCKRNTFKIVY